MQKYKRAVPDFVEAYKGYLKDSGGPVLFKEWAALWCLSAAIERKLWCVTLDSPVFPNIFVMIIGNSGCGKGLAIRLSRQLVSSLGAEKLGMSSMTAAFLSQTLQANERKFVNPLTQQGESYHAINICSEELGVLFPAYDMDMLARLTDLWDCGPYSEGRRKEEHTFACDRTCVTALMATTEVQIHNILPPTAWQNGFMSRTVMVHSSPRKRGSLRGSGRTAHQRVSAIQDMKDTLRHIGAMAGEYEFTPEAFDALDAFYQHEGGLGGPPIPEHPNLLSYCERRHMNIEKLMMLYAASEGDELVLKLHHYEKAHELLLETEAHMSDVFRAPVEGSALDMANKILYSLWRHYQSHGQRPLTKSSIIMAIARVADDYRANNLFNLLEQSGKLKRITPDKLTPEEREKSSDWFIPTAMRFDEI